VVESFRDLLLRSRARTGLTQRDLAARLSIGRRTLQDWEAGINRPNAQRLQALIRMLLEAGGLSAGQEAEQAQALWTAVLQETSRMQTPFDPLWLDQLLAEQVPSAHAPTLPLDALPAAPAVSPAALGSSDRGQDWGEAPDVRGFIGRTDELALLCSWLLSGRCRLVALLGLGGIGKTSLAAKLAQDLVPQFERVYWRSLRDAPPTAEWLAGAIGFLSDQQLVLPPAEAERLTILLQLLRARRCLLVLDNFDTLFEPSQVEGRYRMDVAGYARLLQAVGEASHQSCLILTSREAPPELAALGGEAVCNFPLSGLGVDEARVLLVPKQLIGSSEHWAALTARYGGNGLALKLVGERIRELYDGEIGLFLEEAGVSSVFGGIQQLLDEQVERSSAAELQVLRALAIAREPLHLAELLVALGPRLGRGAMLEALEALRRRSLSERVEAGGAGAFTLQSVVLEYMTDRLVADVATEVEGGQAMLLVEQPLIEATAKDYVRQSQERLIGAPILQQVKACHSEGGTERRLLALLEGWRTRPEAEQGYGPGNVVNLLRLLRGDLKGIDLSLLAIRQAYLAEVDAQDASLAGAHLAETMLADAFDFPVTVALSGDGALLAAGTSTGQVWLWRVADRTLLARLEGHTSAAWAVAFSADGQLLASGGVDGTVQLWEARSGRPLVTLQGHTNVYSVALAAEGELLASGGADGAVRLWDARNGQPLATWQRHTSVVRGVAFSADGHLLASGSWDGTVKLWDTHDGGNVRTLRAEHRYERMNITGLTGITDAQRQALLALGAVDR
jgi:transcriptional regulator with XRE-family HTH domain